MYKFKFNITKEDIDNHIKNSFSEEERETLKNVKFVPFNVLCNDDLDIEVTVVGAFEPVAEDYTESKDNQE